MKTEKIEKIIGSPSANRLGRPQPVEDPPGAGYEENHADLFFSRAISVTGNTIKDFSPLWNLGREDEASDGELWLYADQFREVEGADPLGPYEG